VRLKQSAASRQRSAAGISWGLAFSSIGIFGVLAPVARLIYAQRR